MSRSFICCHKSSIGEENTPPFTTESLTGHLEVIKTINGFEPGVSYSKVFEINTAFAIQKLAEAESQIALPVES